MSRSSARPVAVALLALGACAWSAGAAAQQSVEDLAKQLSNPVSSLVSVPLQNNWDRHVGPGGEGERYTLNLQPVVPMEASEDWNLVTRAILPWIDQSGVGGATGSSRGLGDAVVSAFLSPKAPTGGGWIWGAGPVLLVPTGASDFSADQWGLGPTVVVLRQQGAWSYGALFNHIESLGSSTDGVPDVSASLLNPFVSRALDGGVTVSLAADISRDWTGSTTSIPVSMSVAKVLTVGGQMLQVGAGPRYYVVDGPNGPRGWAFRASIVLLFPR